MRRAHIVMTAAVLALAGCGTGSSGSVVTGGTATTSGKLPGGTAGKDVLVKRKLLDDKGRVAPGPTAPKSETLNAAICDYVFGTPTEVARVAKLSGDISLNSTSGYHYRGGGGEGVECVYQTSRTHQVFVITIWSHGATHTGGASHVVQVQLHDGFHGISAYEPQRRGDTMDRATASQWLTEAGGRVAHGSV